MSLQEKTEQYYFGLLVSSNEKFLPLIQEKLDLLKQRIQRLDSELV